MVDLEEEVADLVHITDQVEEEVILVDLEVIFIHKQMVMEVEEEEDRIILDKIRLIYLEVIMILVKYK